MEPLRRLIDAGWQVILWTGDYCRAIKDTREYLLRWRHDCWIIMG
jgi:hypothetical protein